MDVQATNDLAYLRKEKPAYNELRCIDQSNGSTV